MSLPADKASAHISPHIKDLLRKAMPDGAYSWAEYEAYAQEAQATGEHELAEVMRAIADVEFGAHFYHEDLFSGLINKDNGTNLQTAMDMTKKHLQTFQDYEQKAQSENCSEAAAFFRQMVQVHHTYHDLFQQGKQNHSAGKPINTGPQPHTLQVQRVPPVCGGKMHAELKDAEHCLSMAWATFRLFARKAASTAQPQIAALFQNIAEAEMMEHFATAANLSGLVGSNLDNLKKSIRDETMAHETYTQDLPQIKNDHDQMAAEFIQAAKQDEGHHKKCFEYFLRKMTSRSAAA